MSGIEVRLNLSSGLPNFSVSFLVKPIVAILTPALLKMREVENKRFFGAESSHSNPKVLFVNVLFL